MKITYSHLQSYFVEPLPSVEDVCRTFTFGAFEIEGVEEIEVGGKKEHVIDVKVLPNRAHDCLSWLGIAREYSALTGRQMKSDPFLVPAPTFDDAVKNMGKGTQLRLETADPSLHPSHTLSYIRGVKVAPSPAWLREALEAVGQRSINNVVDATNYVMMEYGQPTHAFDAAKFTTQELNGSRVRGVRIRAARPGETLTILGGKEIALSPTNEVLSDAISGEVLDIAGVKGGTHAELGDRTTELIITSGKYNAANIRKTTQHVGIRTDASKRFENEIPHLLPYYGQQRIQQLILEVAGGEVVETVVVDNAPEKAYNNPVSITLDRIRSTLGSSVSDEMILSVLSRLHLAPVVQGDTVTVTPPWWRFDIEIPEDIVEEVGRVVGYDAVPATPLPTGRTVSVPNMQRVTADAVRDALRTHGFYELQTYSLAETGEVALANSLAEGKEYLRANLASGISAVLSQNEYHAPGVGVYDCLKIFEIGRVFKVEGGKRIEETHACIGVRYLTGKKREEKTNALLLQMKHEIQQRLGVTIDQRIDKETLEFVLPTIPQEKVAELSHMHLPTVPILRYKPLSHFPVALRDVAFWDKQLGEENGQQSAVSSNTSDTNSTIQAASSWQTKIRTAAGPLCTRIDLFDTFTKDGRTSYAFHLAFQSYDKTLTDEDLTPVMTHVYETLKNDGCEVR